MRKLKIAEELKLVKLKDALDQTVEYKDANFDEIHSGKELYSLYKSSRSLNTPAKVDSKGNIWLVPQQEKEFKLALIKT
jgi:hypothetical protein